MVHGYDKNIGWFINLQVNLYKKNIIKIELKKIR